MKNKPNNISVIMLINHFFFTNVGNDSPLILNKTVLGIYEYVLCAIVKSVKYSHPAIVKCATDGDVHTML